ncbi:ABC transporter permease [bacterium]|nr:ABC transporter permease [bacterium]
MKTLLWKEYLYHRWFFLIMAGFGVLSMLLLRYFKSLDSGTAMLMLFGISGPIFITLVGANIFSSETNSNTLPFLLGLPIRRERIWFSKFVFSLLFGSVLYLSYLCIAIFFGVLFPNFEDLDYIFAIPILLFSISLFASILPGSVSILLLCGGILTGFFGAKLLLFFPINLYFLVPLLSVAFLYASRTAFVNGEFLNSWKRVFWGFGGLTAGFLTIFVIFASLDILAEKSFSRNSTGVLKVDYIGPGIGSRMLLNVISTTKWWDPVQPIETSRSLLLNPETGEMTQIGPRNTFPIVDSTGKFIAAGYTLRWPGRVLMDTGSMDAGRLSGEYIIFRDLKENSKEFILEEGARPEGFTNEGKLIYQRWIENKGKPTFEICEYEHGSGTRVIFSAQSPIIDLHIINSISAIIFAKSESNLPYFFVSLKSKVARKIDYYDSNLQEFQDGCWFHRLGYGIKPGEYYSIDASGTIERMSWVPEDSKLLGPDIHGRLFSLSPYDYGFSSTSATVTTSTLSICEKDSRTFKPIREFSDAKYLWGSIDFSKKILILKTHHYNSNADKVYQINLTDPESFQPVEVDSIKALGLRCATFGDKIVEETDDGLWLIDQKSNSKLKIWGIDARNNLL